MEELLNHKSLELLLPEWSASERVGALLAAVRVLGCCSLVLFFGFRTLLSRFAAAFALVWIVGLCVTSTAWRSQLDVRVPDLASQAELVPLAFVSEFAVGAMLGWGVLLFLSVARSMAGFITDQIGFSFGGTLDPSSPVEEPALRAFFGLVAVSLCLSLDLHHDLLRLLAESLLIYPPGQFLVDGSWETLGQFSLAVAAGFFHAVVALAMPVTAVLLLVSLAQGILSRVLPELELFALGFPVRITVGVLVMAFALPATVELMERIVGSALDSGRDAILQLAN